MAVDTKPNLSCEKFEQLSGDILYLSGSTNIHGTFLIEDSGSFCVANGAGSGKVLTSDVYGKATWQSPASSSSSEKISKTITQSSHGFAVGDVVGFSGGTYNKAIADGTYDGEVIGIVIESGSSNVFTISQAGYVTGLTGLVTSCTYFLSDTTAGLLTTFSPTGDSRISKTMLIATSSSSGYVLPYAGYVVTTGETGGGTITGGINGLGDDGNFNICLGGSLINPTTINATTANTFTLCTPAHSIGLGNAICLNSNSDTNIRVDSCAIQMNACATTGNNALLVTIGSGNFRVYDFDSGYGIQYGDDYSATYSSRSLVDKEYVDLAISAATSGNTGSALSVFLISGNSSATGFTVQHNCSSQFVMVQVVEAASPYSTVYTDVLRINANCVCVTFDSPPTTGTNYRILVI